MFDQILDLVGQPPGSLVYHFIILFAVEAALAMSFGQWMRERDEGTARLTIGVAGIFATRTLILIAALLAWRGYLPRNTLLPPVERAVDTITVVGVAWIFITMDDPSILRRNLVPDLIAAAAVGMVVAGFVGTYYYWSYAAASGQLFNNLWLDIAWEIAQIILAVGGLIWMLARFRYVYDPFLKGLILIILSGASGAHLALPTLSDVAATVRVAQIMAMPMLAAVAYRHVIEQLLHWDEFEPSRSPEPLAIAMPPVPPLPLEPSPESFAETKTALQPVEEVKERATGEPVLLEVVEAIGGLMSTLDQTQIARAAARAVATALRADMCALAVIDEETQQAGLIGGYDNIAQSFLPQAVIDLSSQPAIVNAMGRLRQMRMTTQKNLRELRKFYSSLQITHEGPTYLQPLVDDNERIGVLIVGSPYSERLLSEEERNLLDRLGPLVTVAMLNTEAYQQQKDQAEKVETERETRLASLSDEVTALTTDLNSAKRQNEEMKAYIRDLHRQFESLPKQKEEVEKEASRLQDEIERLQKAFQQAQLSEEECKQRCAELENRFEALRQSAAEAERLRADNERLLQKALEQTQSTERISQLEQEIERLRQQDRGQGNRLSSERSSLQQQLEEARLSAESEIALLRARLTHASISQQEVAFLQEQLAAKARETIVLQARLTEAQAIIDALREQIASSVGGIGGLEALQGRIAAQTAEMAALKAQLAEARALGEMAPDVRQAHEDMDQIDREVLGQLEAQLVERGAMIEALETQLAERARAIAELKTHMNDVEKALRDLERQLSHKTDEVAELQASLTATRAQTQERIAVLEQEFESGNGDASEVDRARVVALEAELAEKASAIETLETQLARAQASMTSLEAQLSATNQAVDEAITSARQGDPHDEVIASLAQELRTPMSSIMGYTELLLRESVGILGSLQRKFLQRVKANTERMGVLLDDLIRITALDTGRLELAPEKVDVLYAIEETIMNVANQYREKGVVMRVALPEQLPPITADRDVLLQVLGHLLSNAALASPVEGEVQVSAERSVGEIPVKEGDGYVETDCLHVVVEDMGGGVDPDDYERVFMRKYRADNPLIEGLGDTGVGLSLAKTLVDAHGGHIWLDSQPGVGTTFHVLLPIEPLQEEQVA